uniref:Uncharacterized protein n=1 Tax=Anguilla anguilla TaxID=7936 RepID=A0A0E9UR42_ANGAN
MACGFKSDILGHKTQPTASQFNIMSSLQQMLLFSFQTLREK